MYFYSVGGGEPPLNVDGMAGGYTDDTDGATFKHERSQPEDKAATWKRPDLRNSQRDGHEALISSPEFLSTSGCFQLLEPMHFFNCLSLIELSFPLLVIESVLNKNPDKIELPW